jgi:cytoskeletal protein RodZ
VYSGKNRKFIISFWLGDSLSVEFLLSPSVAFIFGLLCGVLLVAALYCVWSVTRQRRRDSRSSRSPSRSTSRSPSRSRSARSTSRSRSERSPSQESPSNPLPKTPKSIGGNYFVTSLLKITNKNLCYTYVNSSSIFDKFSVASMVLCGFQSLWNNDQNRTHF